MFTDPAAKQAWIEGEIAKKNARNAIERQALFDAGIEGTGAGVRDGPEAALRREPLGPHESRHPDNPNLLINSPNGRVKSMRFSPQTHQFCPSCHRFRSYDHWDMLAPSCRSC